MEIESDPVKAASNIRKHHVSFIEAATTLYDSMAVVQEDCDSMGENRWVLVGLSDQARLLTVVYTLGNEDTIRLISARKATKKEAEYYA